jgi:hypothetical protein
MRVNQFAARSLARRRDLEEGNQLLVSRALAKWAQRSLSVSTVTVDSGAPANKCHRSSFSPDDGTGNGAP